MSFWKDEPKFFMQLTPDLKKGEELYKYQIDHLVNALIVDDYNANVDVDSCQITASTNFKFPAGALISGSFAMHYVAKRFTNNVDIKYDDIDIYFKTKEDAKQFLTMNNQNMSYGFDFKSDVCAYGYNDEGEKMNLIYGVEYDSPGHLISRFDIRACSMCIDPNSNTLYVVRGAIEDATYKKITFNPVPRGCSVRRLVKYVQKGFDIEKHQNLFFAELVKTEIYKPEIELLTKDY